jgi:SAM-dependent methyltransferase
MRELSTVLERLPQGATILDVGCGPMPYKSMVQYPGKTFRYIGADIDPDVMPDCLLREGDPWPIPDQTVDMVVHFYVIEHVRDQAFFFSETHRVLRPGGWLMFTAPCMFVYHACPHDYYRWTQEGLQAALRNWLDVSVVPVDDDYSGIAVNLNQLIQRIPRVGSQLVGLCNLAVSAARKVRPLKKSLMPSGHLAIARKAVAPG